MPTSAALLRGDIPSANQLENLERAYLNAVSAASGCTILRADYDDGIDAVIKHRSALHLRSVDTFLQVQLKCTTQSRSRPPSGTVSVPFKNDRFQLWAEPDPTIKKIAVVMIAPQDPVDWIKCDHEHMLIRNCAYWVCIAGRKPTGLEKTMVAALTSQIFDDGALCRIMARIGQGGDP